MKIIRRTCLILCLIFLIGCFGCAGVYGEEKDHQSLSEFADRQIGILTGSIHDTCVKKYLPDARLLYFTSVSDEATALVSGTIDAFSCDILTARALMSENQELTYVDEAMDYIPTAFAFAKDDSGSALCGQMNGFLAKLESEGTLKELQDKWLSIGAGDYALDMSGLNDNEKTLIFATSCSGKPNAYYYNGNPTGYELEIAVMFCREYGYGIDIQVTDFAGIIPGLVSEKYDFAADGIAVTEERSQSVNFSAPDYQCDIVLVHKKNAEQLTAEYTAVAQLNKPGISLGIITGMALEEIYKQETPEAEIKYYNSLSDMIYALSIDQIQGFIMDTPMADYLASHNEGIACLEEEIYPLYDYAFVFGESEFDEQLKTQYNDYLAKIKADGTLEALNALWFGPEGDTTIIDYPAQGENGTVKVATNTGNPPLSFVSSGCIVGLEMDILAHFCREYGYAIVPEDMDFSALLTGVSSGRYDVAAAYIAITEERRETVNFSDAYVRSGMHMLVRKPVEKAGFWTKLGGSFERTFIREARWKLIVQGIGVTMLITVCAALLGTLLGFGLCMLRCMNKKTVNGIIAVYIRILQGTPLLVLLMILYYIVFARTGMSGEFVAIIAFALNFAAYVSEIFRSGIESIDKGQTEAALAIGLTKTDAFFKIVLPQAAVRFLPVYKGEFISLVKMTSIVGYIAVQDLTKMSDIIRSRTYEAFFPLIATAAIYFILSALLTSLLKAAEIRIQPKRTNRKLKGVKL